MDNINIGNIIPSPLVQQFSKNAQKGHSLDLGSGRGNNSLFLASQDFSVTAIDRNKKALDILCKEAMTRKLKIEIVEQDISKFIIKENYYNFICAMNSLNFLSKKEFFEIIKKIKSGLKENGICTIALFTNEDSLFSEIKTKAITNDGESFHDTNGRRWFFPAKGILKEQFEKEFEILFHIETNIDDLKGHPGNEMPHTHSVARIAIKKKRLKSNTSQ